MISYREIIKDDDFDVNDNYFVSTNLKKMCWGCETKHTDGYMVMDKSKMRRIFFCKDCFDNLKN